MGADEIDLGGDDSPDRVKALSLQLNDYLRPPTLKAAPPRSNLIHLPARRVAEALRFSKLKHFADSPAHFVDDHVKESSPMRKGGALHAYLLGTKDRVAVYPGVRNPKHHAYAAFLEEHPDQLILNESEHEEVQAMRRAIEAHPRAIALLEGEQERRIEWDIAGRRCAGTPDVTRDFSSFRRVVELKAPHTAKPFRLIKHARGRFWHSQVSWYSDGLDRTLSYSRLPCEERFLVAVESRRPYLVTVLRLQPSIIEAGRRIWRRWLESLNNCEASQCFPGYVESDVDWEDEDDGGGDGGLDWSDVEEDGAS